MKKLIALFALCLPVLAQAGPQVASLSCLANLDSGEEVSIYVSNSPMGDGGLVLDIGETEFSVNQEGYEKNVAGNVQWTQDLPGHVATMYLISQANDMHFDLQGIPLSVKYDFAQMPDGNFSHDFKGWLSAKIGDSAIEGVVVDCTYQNTAGMND